MAWPIRCHSLLYSNPHPSSGCFEYIGGLRADDGDHAACGSRYHRLIKITEAAPHSYTGFGLLHPHEDPGGTPRANSIGQLQQSSCSLLLSGVGCDLVNVLAFLRTSSCLPGEGCALDVRMAWTMLLRTGLG